MKELFHGLGILLRLPFYLLAMVLVTVFVVPIALLGQLLGLATIPWVFLKSAFLNRPDMLQEHLNEYWGRLDFGDWYADLWRWLRDGPR